jgi:2-polyprenyl-3-methyl-5-hydroxy-6-metoxy-1,4-benzoquinol methylase
MDASLYEAYEQLEDTHWWFKGRRRIIERVLDRALRPQVGRRILDVGCATGGMFPLLSRFGQVEGAEYSADARERVHRRFPHVRVEPCALPQELPAGSWHLITAFDVIEHLDDPVAALAAMRERLEPEGQLVVTVPALPSLWSRHDELNHHRRRYTKPDFTAHLELAGLTVTFCSYFNSLLLPAVAGLRALQRLAPARFADEGSDLTPVPWPLNDALTALFSLEALALPTLRLPLGVSLLAVAQPR